MHNVLLIHPNNNDTLADLINYSVGLKSFRSVYYIILRTRFRIRRTIFIYIIDWHIKRKNLVCPRRIRCTTCLFFFSSFLLQFNISSKLYDVSEVRLRFQENSFDLFRLNLYWNYVGYFSLIKYV